MPPKTGDTKAPPAAALGRGSISDKAAPPRTPRRVKPGAERGAERLSRGGMPYPQRKSSRAIREAQLSCHGHDAAGAGLSLRSPRCAPMFSAVVANLRAFGRWDASGEFGDGYA